MLHFVMDYAKRDVKSKRLKLNCGRLGQFDVLSGQEPYTNIPECSFKSGAAIPPGKYWIVDRPVGSLKNRARATFIDLWKNTFISGETPYHQDWFGLFSDKTMSNELPVYNKIRSAFCLHPLNADGSGVSEGCITFYSVPDFLFVRRALLHQRKTKVFAVGQKLEVYGYIHVINNPTIHDDYKNGNLPDPHNFFTESLGIDDYNNLLQRGEVSNALLRENACYGQAADDFRTFREQHNKSESDLRTGVSITIIK